MSVQRRARARFPHYPGDSAHDEVEELLDQRRTELSEERTQLAVQRTVWAAEQTLNAWLRTALACVVAGMAIFQFAHTGLTWVGPAIASMLTATGVGFYGFALWRHTIETGRLKRMGAEVTSVWVTVLLVVPLLIAAVLTLLMVVR
jgi:uncharacterized membrane protein YidH (DUF202 family)